MDSVKPEDAALHWGTSSADLAFSIFFLLVLCVVAWLGRLIYVEGTKKKTATPQVKATAPPVAAPPKPANPPASVLAPLIAPRTNVAALVAAAQASSVHTPEPSPKPAATDLRLGPTPADLMFLMLMVLVLSSVVWVGRLIYIEGLKNEVSKQNAHLWATWFAETSEHRFDPAFAVADCAGGPRGNAGPALWGKCLAAITAAGGPLAPLRNPFTHEPPALAAKCDPSNKSLAGALVLEKLVPTPPGSPQPVAASALAEQDPIDQKIQLRVSYCDMGAFPGKPAEVEF